jgi:hypothetical protein
MNTQSKLSAWARSMTARATLAAAPGMSAQAYESELERLFEAYIFDSYVNDSNNSGSVEGTFKPLMAFLGCRNPKQGGVITAPPQPPAAVEAAVTYHLILLMRNNFERTVQYSDHGYAILDGLLRNGRWQACMHTTSDAYAFTVLLLDYLGSDQLNIECKEETIYGAMYDSALGVINAWVRPSTALMELPSRGEMARYLFGETWCDILSAMDAEVQLGEWNICAIVHTQNPPFLTGLLPEHLDARAEPLPSLMLP